MPGESLLFEMIDQPAQGLMLLKPKVIADERGYFFESYSEHKFLDLGIKIHFVQDNQSMSSYGTLRGLHFQSAPKAQTKLVRVIVGEVLDVVVDLRKDSGSFGKSFSFQLSARDHHMLLVPKGFAHGYITLTETAIFSYKCDEFYSPSHEGGLAYNDPDLDIDWKVPESKVMLSARDKKWPALKELKL